MSLFQTTKQKECSESWVLEKSSTVNKGKSSKQPQQWDATTVARTLSAPHGSTHVSLQRWLVPQKGTSWQSGSSDSEKGPDVTAGKRAQRVKSLAAKPET